MIFVHGACVRDAARRWAPMVEPLAARGIDTLAVPLPSCGGRGDELGDLYDDVAALAAGHHPFLSRPGAFADTLAAEIAG